MSIEAVAAVGGMEELSSFADAAITPVPKAEFTALVDKLSGLNQQIQSNDVAVQELALGQTDNLHQVMMNLESTRLQLELVMQVRNKIMDAYQELMRMQV